MARKNNADGTNGTATPDGDAGNGVVQSFAALAPSLAPPGTAGTLPNGLRVERLTARVDGTDPDRSTFAIRESAGGRYVVFTSPADDLLGMDGQVGLIYLRDTQTNTIELVSRSYDGKPLEGDFAGDPFISADGRYVAYRSQATNIVQGGGQGINDAFVFDRVTGQTTSLRVLTGRADATFSPGPFSPDGHYMAFSAVGPDGADLGLYDVQSGTVRYLKTEMGKDAVYDIYSVLNNGGIVWYSNDAARAVVTGAEDIPTGRDTDKAQATADGTISVQYRNYGYLDLQWSHLVGHESDGRPKYEYKYLQASGSAYVPSLTMDASGRYVAFHANFDYATQSNTPGYDVYLWDTATMQVVKLLHADANDDAYNFYDVEISGDGKWVSFLTRQGLVGGDRNALYDAYRVENPLWQGSTATDGDYKGGPFDGTAADDALYGTSDGDTIRGNGGNDVLFGYLGDDALDGGAGNDELYGGWGNDTLTGGGGLDIIYGGTDPDGRDVDVLVLPGDPSEYRFDDLRGTEAFGSKDYTRVSRSAADTELVYEVEHARFDRLRSNDVAHVNMYVQLAEAANAAYKDQAVMGEGWAALSALELGIAISGTSGPNKFTYVNGVYSAKGDAIFGTEQVEAVAQAYFGVVDGKNTLLVAFRGTDQLTVDSQDYPDFNMHYSRFAPFVDAVLKYIANGGYADGGHIDQVWVAGHSLGGAMVQMFMKDPRVVGNPLFTAATFGSPGAASHDYDARMMHFEHTADPVPLAPDVARSLLPPPVLEDLGAITEVHFKGDPTEYKTAGGVVRMVLYRDPLNPNDNLLEEHSMDNYVQSLRNLDAYENLFPFMTQGPSALPESGHVTVSVGTPGIDNVAGSNPAAVNLLRSVGYFDGNDFIVGGGGPDILTGGVGEDLFVGTADELAGDTITDMGDGDRIRVLGKTIDPDQVHYDTSGFGRFGGTLRVGTLFTMEIRGFHPGVWNVQQGNGYTDISYTGIVEFLGGAGQDVLNGGDADDVLAGGGGNDVLHGGAGNDTLYGDQAPGTGTGLPFAPFAAEVDGDDVLEGGEGADTLTGGGGNDTFEGTAAALDGDRITDFSHGDHILVQGSALSLKNVRAIAEGTGTAVQIDANGDGYYEATVHLDQSLAELEQDGYELNVSRGAGGSQIGWVHHDTTGFQAAQHYRATGNYSVLWLDVADVNGDGRPDVLTVDPSGQNVAVMLNNGVGGYRFTAKYGVGLAGQLSGPYPTAVTTSDLNGDGLADMLVVDNGQDKVEVRLNLGGGRFGDAVRYAVGGQYRYQASPRSVVAADVNGDGRPDMVAGLYEGGGIAVRLNDGVGGFGEQTVYKVGVGYIPQAGKVVAADFNGDGKIDLAVVNPAISQFSSINGAVSVLLNDGTGKFAAPQVYNLAYEPSADGIAVGDIDGDGRLDLVTVGHEHWGDGHATVLLNRGNGTFGQRIDYLLPRYAGAVSLADFNADGRLDIATNGYVDGKSSTYVLLNEGADGFGPAQAFSVGEPEAGQDDPDVFAVVAKDVNGDGRPDLVSTDNGRSLIDVQLNTPGAVRVTDVAAVSSAGAVLNAGKDVTITLTALRSLQVDLGPGGAAPTLQLSNGGTATYLGADPSGRLQFTYRVAAGQDTSNLTVTGMALNGAQVRPTIDAPGVVPILYEPARAFGFGGYEYFQESLAIGDLDGDGKQDMVLGLSTGGIGVRLGDGKGGFADAKLWGGTGYTFDDPKAVLAVDLNGDGKLDVVTSSSGLGSIAVRLNDGAAGFATATTYAIGPEDHIEVSRLAAADMDGDGKLDLLVTNGDDKTVSVLLNDGSGAFGAPVAYGEAAAAITLVAADVNGDGKQDVVQALYDDTVSVRLGDGHGSLGAATTLAVGDHLVWASLADLDGDGKLDLVTAHGVPAGRIESAVPGTVAVRMGDGAGGFGPATTYATGNGTVFVGAADVDGNGALDLVVSNQDDKEVAVLLNDRTGHFGAPVTQDAGDATDENVVIADLNGDGRQDVVALSNTSAIRGTILLHTAPDAIGPFDPGTVGGAAGSRTGLVVDTVAPTVTIGLVADTGPSGTDGVTTDARLAGTAEANRTVTLTEGGAVLGTATANAQGAWAITPVGLALGTHQVTAIQTDLAGNVGSAALSFTFTDGGPVVTAVLANDTGRSAADRLTSSPALAGTGAPNGTVTVLEGTAVLGTAATDGQGRWSFTPSGLAEGAHAITVRQTDAGGLVGTATLAFVLDTRAPATGIKLAADTGASATDGLTSDPTLVGTAEAGALVTISEGGTALGTALASGAGTWSFTPSGLADGTHLLTASQIDAAGNMGSAAVQVVLDTSAPATTAALLTDTGSSALDRVTRIATLTGRADPYATVTLKEGSTVLGTAAADAQGTWSFTPAGLADGAHAVTAAQADAAGNVGTAALAFTLDTTAPTPTLALVHGVLDGDNDWEKSWSADDPALQGTAEANRLVTISSAAGGVLGTTVADADGNWSFTPAGLADGFHVLEVSQTDEAGNTGTASLNVTLEGTASVVQFAPAAASVAEGGGMVALTVVRSGGRGAVTVQYATADGSAKAGDADGDYVAQSGTLSWAEGDMSDRQILVAIRDDAVFEGQEAFSVGLGAPGGGAVVGANATATVSIVDDEAKPTLSVSSVAVTEGDGGTAGVARFVVTLSGPSASPVQVGYATTDGTALAGSDYAATRGTLTFDPGATAQEVLVPVLGDGTSEPDEAFALVLSSPVGADLGSAVGTATIRDDDLPTPTPRAAVLSVTAAPADALLGVGGTAVFRLDMSAAVTVDAGSGGGPVLRLSNGGLAAYDAAASTSRSIAFSYTVLVGQDAADVAVAGVALNGAVVRDVAGGDADLSGAQAEPAGILQVDTVAPEPTAALLHDTGAYATDGVTRDASLSGTAEANRLVTVLNGSAVLGTTTADAQGRWSLAPVGLADGSYVLTVSQADAAGNLGRTDIRLTLDTTAPAVSIALAGGADGSTGEAGAVRDATLSGHAEAGAQVLLSDASGLLGVALADGGGSWAFTPAGLADGRHVVTASQIDAAGNVGAATLGFTLDTTPPVASPSGDGAAAAFAVLNTTTGQRQQAAGERYTGPVAGLDWQYVSASSDSLNVTANMPNTFVHTGSGTDAIDVSGVGGTNVLDGGTGSNFLVGGTGPGSRDTFFVDDRNPAADIWSTVANFHAGDTATVFGITAQDYAFQWVDGQGAAGYTGLTLHATAAGKPTASITLAGYSTADLNNGKLTTSFGTVDGSNYLYIQGVA